MRYVIVVTLLRGHPIRFFAKGQTKEEAHQEGLDYIHAWPLDAKNQPCRLRIEESRWLYAEIERRTP